MLLVQLKPKNNYIYSWKVCIYFTHRLHCEVNCSSACDSLGFCTGESAKHWPPTCSNHKETLPSDHCEQKNTWISIHHHFMVMKIFFKKSLNVVVLIYYNIPHLLPQCTRTLQYQISFAWKIYLPLECSHHKSQCCPSQILHWRSKPVW